MKDLISIFPEEIWEMILEQLKDSTDISNLFQACPKFGEMFHKKKWSWMGDRAILHLLPWLEQKEILACRQTSKKLFQAISMQQCLPHIPASGEDDDPSPLWFGNFEWFQNEEGGPKELKHSLCKISQLPSQSQFGVKNWPDKLVMQPIPKIWLPDFLGRLVTLEHAVVVDFKFSNCDSLKRLLNHESLGSGHAGVVRVVTKDGEQIVVVLVGGTADAINRFFGIIPDDQEAFMAHIKKFVHLMKAKRRQIEEGRRRRGSQSSTTC